MQNTPLFVVFEGLDGSGKTTVSKAVHRRFLAEIGACQWTCEPSSNHVGGEFIRKVLAKTETITPWGLAMLFAANRLHHVTDEINPALALGSTVICDRYVMSSIVYQAISGVAIQDILTLNQQAREPNLTILLEVSPTTVLERKRARGLPQELFEAHDKSDQAIYLYKRAEFEMIGDVVRVNAEKPLEDVVDQCFNIIKRHWQELNVVNSDE